MRYCTLVPAIRPVGRWTESPCPHRVTLKRHGRMGPMTYQCALARHFWPGRSICTPLRLFYNSTVLASPEPSTDCRVAPARHAIGAAVSFCTLGSSVRGREKPCPRTRPGALRRLRRRSCFPTLRPYRRAGYAGPPVVFGKMSAEEELVFALGKRYKPHQDHRRR